jgi:hypothetical protein
MTARVRTIAKHPTNRLKETTIEISRQKLVRPLVAPPLVPCKVLLGTNMVAAINTWSTTLHR